jgi:hypothetical protein
MARQKLFKKLLINYQSDKSVAFRLRRKRAERIKKLISDCYQEHGAVRIIDIGGTRTYWNIIPGEFLKERNAKITLVNLPDGSPLPEDDEIFSYRHGNGCNLAEYPDKSFHLSHSNSVIEHVGDDGQIRKFANESKRVAEKYYLQTPNFWFPVEPHFVTPVFHWLPVSLRIWLLRHFNLGWYRRSRDYKEAKASVNGIRLLKGKELRALFPECTFHLERFAGLPKSLIVIKE